MIRRDFFSGHKSFFAADSGGSVSDRVGQALNLYTNLTIAKRVVDAAQDRIKVADVTVQNENWSEPSMREGAAAYLAGAKAAAEVVRIANEIKKQIAIIVALGGGPLIPRTVVDDVESSISTYWIMYLSYSQQSTIYTQRADLTPEAKAAVVKNAEDVAALERDRAARAAAKEKIRQQEAQADADAQALQAQADAAARAKAAAAATAAAKSKSNTTMLLLGAAAVGAYLYTRR